MASGVETQTLVGRDEELGRIEAFLAHAGGGPAGLVLEGEPGIGKTTLWRTGVDVARERGFTVLLARPAEAERDLSFATLGDFLAGFHDAVGALPDPQRRALRVALLLEDPTGTPPDQRAVGVAVTSLLRSLARAGPVLIACDDVQWSDRPSAAAIAFALRRREDAAISFLASRRLGTSGDLPYGDPTIVSVDPLPEDGIARLLYESSNGALLRPQLKRLAAASGGNPFFALELARAYLQDGERSGVDVPIPTSLGHALRRRLSPLSGATRLDLILVAAGSRPTRGLLRRAGAGDLGDAVAADIVEIHGDRVRFTHPLLGAEVLAEADADAIASAHRALADLVDDAEQRARHLAAAMSSPDSAVADSLDQAALEARRRGAPEAAARLAEEAVRATPSEERGEVFRRLLDAAECVNDAGDAARATLLAERAVRAAASGRQRAAALYYLARVRPDSGTGATLRTIEAALAEDDADATTRAAATTLAVHLRLANRADPEECSALAREAYELATVDGDVGLQALALAAVGESEFHLGHGIPVELMERAIALEKQAPSLELDFRPRTIYAYQLFRTHQLDAAEQIFEEVEAIGREASDPSLALILVYLGHIAARRTDHARAAALADEALEIAQQSGRTSIQCFALNLRLVSAAERGEIELGRELVSRILTLADATEDRASRAMALNRAALLELSIGAPQAAYDLLAPELELLRRRRFDPNNEAFMTSCLIDAAVEVGHPGEAQGLLDGLEARMTDDDPRTSALALRARGIIASALGDHDAAVAALDEAVRRIDSFESPLLKASTLLALGRARRRARHHGEARATLEHAQAMFAHMGAEEWAARVTEELARIGGRPATHGRLTPTERRIAELVAQGRTNQEVASVLFVSTKTVEWNLSKIYKKLHVRSRTELAAKTRRG